MSDKKKGKKQDVKVTKKGGLWMLSGNAKKVAKALKEREKRIKEL